jgi:hypothetical protein
MSARTLTVTRLVEDHIDGIEIEGDAFGDLLDRLGVAPKVERREAVTSAEPGDETRTYIVSVHTVPGTDGTTQVYACTCGAFKFHELPKPGEMRGDIEAGFENIGRCKHGDEIAVKDRTTEDRETGQQGFERFAQGENQ